MKKIKKGDEIIVIAGKDKGRKGIVQAVLEKGQRLIVEGINIAKKHTKVNPNTKQGGIVMQTRPIHCSNVMIYDQASEKGTRVGIRQLENGKNTRYFKSSNEPIDV